jgi:hypothetical protein
LSANYVARRLTEHYPVLYTGRNGLVAHECILDLRPITAQTGITAEDVAKRLIDYGFHAPTMSFPVAGTLMVEPTESEDLAELDRFCHAMIAIRHEIELVAAGEYDAGDNPLKNAPHTASMLISGDWKHAYDRETAAYPAGGDRRAKYWPPVRRIDQAYGDRNLMCACPPPSAFESGVVPEKPPAPMIVGRDHEGWCVHPARPHPGAHLPTPRCGGGGEESGFVHHAGGGAGARGRGGGPAEGGNAATCRRGLLGCYGEGG